MGLPAAIWDGVEQLCAWARATADEVDGRGQIEIASGETRNDVEHLGLPGFYACVCDDDELLAMRRDDGGITIAARTARPSGAEAGDRGITTADGLHVRCRGTTVYITGATEVRCGGATLVVLDGDIVVPDAAFLAHTHTGVTVGIGTTGAPTPGVTTIGTCSSSAAITKGG